MLQRGDFLDFIDRKDKQAQVTIFIIIAVVILAFIALFFVLKATVLPGAQIPSNLEPAYQGFWDCVSEKTSLGIGILESQGGYIVPPEFESGSEFMPFSSELNFLGNPIPYWYYVSGNGFQRTQVPAKGGMEKQLAEFVQQRTDQCDFNSFYQQGFLISQGATESVKIIIHDKSVDVQLNKLVNVTLGEDSAQVQSHNVVVDSNLGRLYNSARKVYDYEQETLFLENYGVDILRLYAPTDGVEISCAPKIWSADEIFNDLSDAIVENTLSLKAKGGDYTLKNPDEGKYFVVDLPADESVSFLTSKNWPYGFEVTPSNENLLVANPVGNQKGLGVLGFCYVPYHFVYNVKYPVLIQLSRGEEIFQFPMAVVIQGNNPRNPTNGSEAFVSDRIDACETGESSSISVNVYDEDLNKIPNAKVSFNCLGGECSLGNTDESGSLTAVAPQCLNGIVRVDAEGFKESTTIVSTNTLSVSGNVFLQKEYNKELALKLDNSDYGGQAVISFSSDDESKTAVYPDQNTISLSDGQYDVEVYIYRDAAIKLEEVTKEQCLEVPQDGIGGLLGLKKEKCIDIVIPAQTITSSLAGGGKQKYYFSQEELNSDGKLEINVPSLPIPQNLEDLQKNYILFDSKTLDINVK